MRKRKWGSTIFSGGIRLLNYPQCKTVHGSLYTALIHSWSTWTETYCFNELAKEPQLKSWSYMHLFISSLCMPCMPMYAFYSRCRSGYPFPRGNSDGDEYARMEPWPFLRKVRPMWRTTLCETSHSISLIHLLISCWGFKFYQIPNPVLCPAIDGMETHLLHDYIPVLHELKDLQKIIENPRCAWNLATYQTQQLAGYLKLHCWWFCGNFPQTKQHCIQTGSNCKLFGRYKPAHCRWKARRLHKKVCSEFRCVRVYLNFQENLLVAAKNLKKSIWATVQSAAHFSEFPLS